ncbi:MAG: hypothetical protein Q9216_006712 [Gyalolechia sp. 2 TL-2023]
MYGTGAGKERGILRRAMDRVTPQNTSSTKEETSHSKTLEDFPFSDADKRTIIALEAKTDLARNPGDTRIWAPEIAESLQYTHQIESTDPTTMKMTFNKKPPRRVTDQDVIKWMETSRNKDTKKHEHPDAHHPYDGSEIPYWWVVHWWYRRPNNMINNERLPTGMKEEDFAEDRTRFWFLMGKWRKDNQTEESVEIHHDHMPKEPLQN